VDAVAFFPVATDCPAVAEGPPTPGRPAADARFDVAADVAAGWATAGDAPGVTRVAV
jgi:hypothetical protein